MTSWAPHFHYLKQSNKVQECFKVWMMSYIFTWGQPRRDTLMLMEPFQYPWIHSPCHDLSSQSSSAEVIPEVILRVRALQTTVWLLMELGHTDREAVLEGAIVSEWDTSLPKMGLSANVTEHTFLQLLRKGLPYGTFSLSIGSSRGKN